jgi:hypothetical protein
MSQTVFSLVPKHEADVASRIGVSVPRRKAFLAMAYGVNRDNLLAIRFEDVHGVNVPFVHRPVSVFWSTVQK